MTDESLERPRYHWPHAAASCKAYLDLDALEPLAVRVLARSLLTQRLVAFVGAGVSASYGRQTWNGLLRELWRRAQREYAKRDEPGWPRLRERLWANDESQFLDYGDHAVKAQVLHDMLELRPGKEREGEAERREPESAEELQRETKFWLEDFHGFVEWIVEEWKNGDVGSDRDSRMRRRKSIERWIRKDVAKNDIPSKRGLVPVLEELLRAAGTAGAPDLRRALVRALMWQSTDVDSPLRLLIREYRVRRFMTTNYDHEIERGLEGAGFVERHAGNGALQAEQFARLSFGRHHTGAALRFALEGPRRNAEVLHLHGDVEDASSLIVTEAHYQQLYLDDHPLRDLVNNATLANFGANPVLFVGSDVSEDDVLRPMRQFMSGEGHRSDRMAVALFISSKTRHERAQRQVMLWLKYGVYALDVGRAIPAPEGESSDLWLVELLRLQRKFAQPDPESGPPWKFRNACEQLKRLKPPTAVEGVTLSPEDRTAFGERLEHLNAVFRREGRTDAPTPEEVRRARVVLDISVSWFSSRFLCAKLTAMRRRALGAIEDDSTLACSYRAPLRERSSFEPSLRHAVQHGHPLVDGRFERIADEAFDEHIGELCSSIRAAKEFAKSEYRRVVIVSAARGHGKGAQFDRLLADSPDSPGFAPHLICLQSALGHYGAAEAGLPAPDRIVHANLSFSNELGPLVSQVIDVMLSMVDTDAGTDERQPAKDQLEMLGRAMHALSMPGASGRLLLVLGNAGVLFDAEGRPKNGQIRRVMRALLSPRFTAARLDILMYVGESQMPEDQRIPAGRKLDVDVVVENMSVPEVLAADMRRRRRLYRLNIDGRTPIPRDDGSPLVLVHPLRKTRVSQLAKAYFEDVAGRMGWSQSAGDSEDQPRDELDPDDDARRLYFATGGSRLAQTLLMCWLEAALTRDAVATDVESSSRPVSTRLVDRACAALRVAPAASAVEACVEFVLDEWSGWHIDQKRDHPPLPAPAPKPGVADELVTAIGLLAAHGSTTSWSLATELLWHLSAFSHPVEISVLIRCPRVAECADLTAKQLNRRTGAATPLKNDTVALAMLELLVHWCLAFRIRARSVPGLDRARLSDPDRVRYTVHRHIQRHFLRLMGGRNLEATAWDQYTTTLYASLPDESPILHAEVHATLVKIVRQLSAYPEARAAGVDDPSVDAGVGPTTFERMVVEADCIRAAYYLVRSTYSLGVVSHLTPDAARRVGRLGHLEQYRRLVRWITHEARYWERRHGIGRGQTDANAVRWSGGSEPRGLFYPGELIWLYAECGVISLAQGKLHDAEQLLTMAETAARRVEADDTGSLHTRIRIHSALVQIERGRPERARQILLPIAQRRHGHPVPPLLAEFYLGQLDHLGGSYAAAHARYERALKGLRRVDRSRASSFVLMNLADVMYVMKKQVTAGLDGNRPVSDEVVGPALVKADEAISLAQQGGHEDLRMLATMSRVRICIDANRITGENLFQHLSAAQRYAVLNDIPRLACEVHELRARLLMRQGEFNLSANDVTQSLEIAAMYDLKLKKARGLLTLSEIYMHRGERNGARDLATMGREIAQSCDYASCLRGFSELELRLGA